MNHIWRIHLRHLSFCPSDRKPFSYLIACDSSSEGDAKNFLQANWGSAEWWEETIITDLEYVGELHAVRGGGA